MPKPLCIIRFKAGKTDFYHMIWAIPSAADTFSTRTTSSVTIGYRYAKGKPEVVRVEGISSGGDS